MYCLTHSSGLPEGWRLQQKLVSGVLCVIYGFRRDVRSALFGDCMHRRMAVSYTRFGTTYRSQLQGSSNHLTIWPLKTEAIGCPETSVRNYQLMLPKIPKERRSCSKSVENKKVCALVPTELCLCALYSYMCRGSSVSIVSRLRPERPRNVDSCSGEGRLYSPHSGSVPHPASHPFGPRGSFLVLNIAEYLTTKFTQVPRLRKNRPVYPLSHASSWYGAKLNIRVEGSLAVSFSNIWFFLRLRLRAISSVSTGRRICPSVLWWSNLDLCTHSVQEKTARLYQLHSSAFFIPLQPGIYVIPTANISRLHDEENPIIFVQGNNRFLFTSLTKCVILWRLICNFSIRRVEHISWTFGNNLDSAHLQQFCYHLVEY